MTDDQITRVEGATTYKFVGHVPDPRLANFRERMENEVIPASPGTSRQSWQDFLQGCRFSAPIDFGGEVKEVFAANNLMSAWKPIYPDV